MIPATEGDFRLQMKSKSSMPWTARGCRPLVSELNHAQAQVGINWDLLNETSCLVMEEGVFSARAQWPAGSTKAADVVVGG